jgi:hypothetical protein
MIVQVSHINRALKTVWSDLDAFGCWDEALSEIEIFNSWWGTEYGWQDYGGSGAIFIPAISLSRISAVLCGKNLPLADILRHEFGHAIARYASRADAFLLLD